MWQLTIDLENPPDKPLVIFKDNQSTMCMYSRESKGTRNIEMKYHLLNKWWQHSKTTLRMHWHANEMSGKHNVTIDNPYSVCKIICRSSDNQ